MKSPGFKFSSLIIIIILILGYGIKTFFHTRIKNSNLQNSNTYQTQPSLNRNEQHLILTKHARCRMECRHINEDEIKEILHDGNINYTKSDLQDKRGPKYAMEGVSKEHQHLRIIFAPESDGLVVVTCIDLDNEWQCDCN